MTDPYTVERLREMMANAPEPARQHSTCLWAANEIERLRSLVLVAEGDADRLATSLRILNLDIPAMSGADEALRIHDEAVLWREQCAAQRQREAEARTARGTAPSAPYNPASLDKHDRTLLAVCADIDHDLHTGHITAEQAERERQWADADRRNEQDADRD